MIYFNICFYVQQKILTMILDMFQYDFQYELKFFKKEVAWRFKNVVPSSLQGVSE